MKSYKQLNEDRSKIIAAINKEFKKHNAKPDKYNKSVGGQQFTGSVGAYFMNGQIHVNFPTSSPNGEKLRKSLLAILKKGGVKVTGNDVGASNYVIKGRMVNEAKSAYETYHSSYTEAIREVENFVKKKKFVLDPEEMASTVGFGPPKPGAGKTNRFSLSLYKNDKDLLDGKKQRKMVHFQVYGMGGGNLGASKYELNAYIS